MAEDLSELQSVLSMLMQSDARGKTQDYQDLILKRIAEETDVKPSRIPAPLNITEVGGYFNLIEQVETDDPALKAQKAKKTPPPKPMNTRNGSAGPTGPV